MKAVGKLVVAVALMVVVGMTSGCMGPPKIEQLVVIENNETAFLVPLEGKSKESQGKFMSIDYLDANKVATKRVTLPLRKFKTGRWSKQYQWIPTAKVIKVDRAPVTREWTQGKETGTSASNQAIAVESKDSIGFSAGVNITARISEEDAATYLYNYPSGSLKDVIDTNIRGYVQSFLSSEFGIRDIEACKSDKKTIFDALSIAAIEHFAKYGITITNLGFSEGLIYDNKDIQTAIDNVQQAEMDVKKAQQELEAQRIRNTQKVEMAAADRKAAQEFAQAQAAAVAKTQLDIQLTLAKAWNGQYPANMLVLPNGGSSNMMFNLPFTK